jgi:hypothetical protein
MWNTSAPARGAEKRRGPSSMAFADESQLQNLNNHQRNCVCPGKSSRAQSRSKARSSPKPLTAPVAGAPWELTLPASSVPAGHQELASASSAQAQLRLEAMRLHLAPF